jgi:hypothetical protein
MNVAAVPAPDIDATEINSFGVDQGSYDDSWLAAHRTTDNGLAAEIGDHARDPKALAASMKVNFVPAGRSGFDGDSENEPRRKNANFRQAFRLSADDEASQESIRSARASPSECSVRSALPLGLTSRVSPRRPGTQLQSQRQCLVSLTSFYFGERLKKGFIAVDLRGNPGPGFCQEHIALAHLRRACTLS